MGSSVGIWTVANGVSLARILLVPVFGMLASRWLADSNGPEAETWRWLAFVVFVGVAATDGLDGWLARRLNQVSRLGSWLDPIADRSLALLGLFLFTRPDLLGFPWLLPTAYSAFVVGREVLLLTGALTVRRTMGLVSIRPRLVGKVATIVQLVVIGVLLLKMPVSVVWIAIVISVGVSFVSAVFYTRDGMNQMSSPSLG